MSMVSEFPKLKGSRSWLVRAAREMFATAEAQPVARLETPETDRAARVADHEEDKRLLSEVEKHDLAMLDRVRSALYKD
ncbi:MAG: hypothetical protein HLUCCA08_13135 [Rhodobacteraceae bacterium HLUCCA08]|nr:MAG: hypothetical protein HLUCCA08_13135 [Rhodobacteraceae bacterium HLUCCA08]